MLLLLNLSIAAILVCILVMLYMDDRANKRRKTPMGRMQAFWDEKNRRQFIRYQAELGVRYTHENILADGKTRDMSLGGICLIACEKPRINTILQLEIEIPFNRQAITAHGKVAWVKEDVSEKDDSGRRYFIIGLEFIKISAESRAELSNYIKNH
ncbi:MAG: PilZ domain-containing protein [Candidatus Omnitrophota bacterium]